MTTEVRPGPAELLSRMAGGRLYREAYSKGMMLSAFLEREDPSSNYPGEHLDAFERMMRSAGIVARSDPARGLYADTFDAFGQNENTLAMVPEWAARQWRKVSFGDPSMRALYTSTDDIPGSLANPQYDITTPRPGSRIAPAIPLSELVALTTPVDGSVVRSFYFSEVAADRRLVRVAEGSEIPRVKISGGEHSINLYKYGRVIEATYEQLRRQRIDKVAFWIQRVAVQAETDKVATALDVLVNGDGNSGTAATNHNLTTLDTAAVAGTMTLKGWLNFKLQFANPYAMTHALVNAAGALQLMLLNVGSANVPLVVIQAASGFGGFTPINPELADNVRLGITTDAPTLKVVGFDARFALERFTEIGADIQEVERWSTRQTQTITLTETEGYGIVDGNATRTLNINA